MPEGLLRTKLFAPQARPRQVARLGLFEKLNSARLGGTRLFLVSAPAGFGKTGLVSAWARASGLPLGWVTLDEGDNDPLRFWRYLDAALESIDPQIGKALRPALYAAQSPVFQQIITGLVNDIVVFDRELILVLEDYHLIAAAEIHEALNYLIEHMPQHLHLVITTRSDPPLNLARRRGRSQICEIRAADLRFSPAETAFFLNQVMQLGLSPEDIRMLSSRTEGWIAGLQMLALSMEDEFDRHAFVTAFSGDDRYIADYLIEEVLSRQPVEFQRFLLQTSILDRLSAPLCNAVTGRQDSRALLNVLERANLFIIPLDNRREWFRYHILFADLLRRRLAESVTPAELAGLYQATSEWYESQGDIAAAVRYARQAGDQQRILSLLERSIMNFYMSGELPQFFELVNSALEPALRRESPLLCMAAAWAGLASTRYSEVAAWVDPIELHFGMPALRALEADTMDTAVRAALLEVLLVRLQFPVTRPPAEQRLHILAIRQQLERLPDEQHCLLNIVGNLHPVVLFNLALNAEETGDTAQAVALFAECSPLSRQKQNSSLFHLSAGHLANLYMAQGHLRLACQAHESALAQAGSVTTSISPFISLSHAGLAALYYEWDQLEQAAQAVEAGLAQARLWNQWESLVPLTLLRAHLMRAAGDLPQALAVMTEAGRPPLAGMDFALQAYTALLRAASDAQAQAAAWLADTVDLAQLEATPATEGYLLTVVRLLLLLGRPSEAESLLEQIYTLAQAGGRKYILAQAQVLRAQAQTAQGRPAEALAGLLETLQQTQPEGYIRTFVDEGEPLRGLLAQAALQARPDRVLWAYIQRILAAFPATGKPALPAASLVEPLSERELEVLGLMAQGLSNPQIAARLYLSPNTLKAHTQNIFSKLDVHNRLQAVNRARDLELLGSGSK